MAAYSSSSPLEIWGGVESTVNRVGEVWLDQLAKSGHDRRISDLDLFADLGLKTIRYPFLWERLMPGAPREGNWHWAYERLQRLGELGIRPIAGLVHHGSGPVGTSLADPDFPEKLAAYAREFARRFPEVEDYTPINEPLTTARFSGLYGIWYPHGKDERSFLTALLNECRGTVLAMQEIRKVNPQARLIQTEDMGRIFSTLELAEQADFENERRWLSLDLLCGRVTENHPLWLHLTAAGFTAAEILWFAENPCAPDIIGINHYVTSNRYLDSNLELYPQRCHGGNGRHAYADVEAVRVEKAKFHFLDAILLETWERYHLPLAVTEAHLTCTREEQVRWLLDIRRAALTARRKGADVRAVTVWALLGLYDWHCLLTKGEGCYEVGVFDLSDGAPRPTALAHTVKSLTAGKTPKHPVLEPPGWWRRDIRVLFPPPAVKELPGISGAFNTAEGPWRKSVPLLIAANGTPGETCIRLCEVRGIPWRRAPEITSVPEAEQALETVRPWAVLCFTSDPDGHEPLAEACAQHGTPCIVLTDESLRGEDEGLTSLHRRLDLLLDSALEPGDGGACPRGNDAVPPEEEEAVSPALNTFD